MEVASGYIIDQCHSPLISIFPLIFRSIVIEGKEYSGAELRSSPVEKAIDMLFDIEEVFDVLDSYVLYDDIVKNKQDLGFKYKYDDNISIGAPGCGCTYMLYVVQAGDYSSTVSDGVSDDTLLRLVQWKQELVRSGRMKEALFQAVGNCCT